MNILNKIINILTLQTMLEKTESDIVKHESVEYE